MSLYGFPNSGSTAIASLQQEIASSRRPWKL